MYRGPYCYYCYNKGGDGYQNKARFSHNDSDHVTLDEAAWIPAESVKGGDRVLLDYRGTREYLRIIHSARPSKVEGRVVFWDSSHRKHDVPADKLVSAYVITDDFKEK